MLIKACLNGSREPGALDALPLSPTELARAARSAIEAGAGALHIHPRRADGAQSFAAEDCGAAFAAIRASCPGMPVGGTTAAWIEPEEQETAAALAVVAAIEHVLDHVGVQTPRLLHGFEATTWPLLDIALQRGYDTRIGLEDTLLLPDGRQARDNAQLVSIAYERARQAGRI